MEIPTGVHYNHRMVSALSFICMCVFVIVRVCVFVIAYTARNTLILDAIISTFKLIPCILKKIISNIFVFKKVAVTPCNETTFSIYLKC